MTSSIFYYIDFTLLLVLIRRLEKDFVLHCRTLYDIIECDLCYVTSRSDISYSTCKYVLSLICFARMVFSEDKTVDIF